uniref:Mannose-6-phosphate isomerase n=1 Tax=Rhabditophanes sp. KR3021 TaxID=114890 RepID=A0AC35UEH5_9BILA
MQKLICPIQHYLWGKEGDSSLVSQLKKAVNDQYENNLPFAELWMGTHPNGPARLHPHGQLLTDYLANNSLFLGKHEKGGLEFLFKVLSVGKPLSIQAHPTKEQAIVLHRIKPNEYPDDNHKPEMAIALTDFELLCGFKLAEDIKTTLFRLPELLEALDVVQVNSIGKFENPDVDPLKKVFCAVLEGHSTTMPAIIRRICDRLNGEEVASLTDTEKLILRLDKLYPGDVGVLIGATFLNHFTLKQGESVFLGPNVPHAYLDGDCIECMACSDNTIRAGLTPKYKDIETLKANLHYDMTGPIKFAPEDKKDHILYKPRVKEFAVIKYDKNAKVLNNVGAASILVVIGGSATIMGSTEVTLSRGEVLLAPATESSPKITDISDDFLCYRAYKPGNEN